MIYTIESNELTVQINSLGAELWSIINREDGTEYLWQGDKAIWPRRAPILFPYCGRLKDDQFILDDDVYKSPLHGFARDYEHRVEKMDETSITFLFSDDDETIKKYPYHFSLHTTFKLEGNKLTQTFRVENQNPGEMFFSIGYHPGYKVPFDDRHKVEDYSLIFEKEETPTEIICNNQGLLSGEQKVRFENKSSIQITDDLFPASFALTGLRSEYVSLVEADTGRSIRVGIKDFPYVVFWSTPRKVNFVCIEPWYGLPDSFDTDGQFKNKHGILCRSKGEHFVCSMTVEIGQQESR